MKTDSAPILVVFDYRQYIPDLMATARSLSAGGSRNIHLLVTIPVPSTVTLDTARPDDEDLAESVIEEARVDAGRRTRGRWVKVRAGQAGHVIVGEAKALRARAIVMPVQRSAPGGWSDQTIETVLRERPCRVYIESVPAAMLPTERPDPGPRRQKSAQSPTVTPADLGSEPSEVQPGPGDRATVPAAGTAASGAWLRPWERVQAAEYSLKIGRAHV